MTAMFSVYHIYIERSVRNRTGFFSCLHFSVKLLLVIINQHCKARISREMSPFHNKSQAYNRHSDFLFWLLLLQLKVKKKKELNSEISLTFPTCRFLLYKPSNSSGLKNREKERGLVKKKKKKRSEEFTYLFQIEFS